MLAGDDDDLTTNPLNKALGQQAPSARKKGQASAPKKVKQSLKNLRLCIEEEERLQDVSNELKKASAALSTLDNTVAYLQKKPGCSPAIQNMQQYKPFITACQKILDEADSYFCDDYCQKRAEKKAAIMEATRNSDNPRETFMQEHANFNKEDAEHREILLQELSDRPDFQSHQRNLFDKAGFEFTTANIELMKTALTNEVDALQQNVDTTKAGVMDAKGQIDLKHPDYKDFENAKKAFTEGKKRQEDFMQAVAALQLSDADAKDRLLHGVQGAVAALSKYNEDVLAAQQESFRKALHDSWVDKSLPKDQETSMAESAFGADDDKVHNLSKLSRQIGVFTKVHTDGQGIYFDTTHSFFGYLFSKICPASDATALEKAKLIVKTAEENDWGVINLRNLDEKTAAFVVLEQMRCEKEYGFKPKNIFYHKIGDERGRCIREVVPGPDGLPDADDSRVENPFLDRRTTLSGVPLLETSKLGFNLADITLDFLPSSALTHRQKYNNLIAKQAPDLEAAAMGRLQAATSAEWYNQGGTEKSVKKMLDSKSKRYSPEEKSKIASEVLAIKKDDPRRFPDLDEAYLKGHIIDPNAKPTAGAGAGGHRTK